MHLEKFVNSYTGKVLMSILLGIGLATFFRSVCKGKQCRIKTSPPLENMEGQTYQIHGGCYQYEINSVSCQKSGKRTMRFA